MTEANKPQAPLPPWAETLMRLYRHPMKPPITVVLGMWPDGESKPTYDQARRFLRRMEERERAQRYATLRRRRMGVRHEQR